MLILSYEQYEICYTIKENSYDDPVCYPGPVKLEAIQRL